jgi:transposase
MVRPPLHVLSEAEKNELLLAPHEMIERMAARISELEALFGKPRKASSNSHTPPSKDDFSKKGGRGRKSKTTKRPPREGKHRPLSATPDKTERVIASACDHCGTDVSGQTQQCRQRYDHVDLRPIRPVVTRIELWGGRCRCCGHRYKAQAPAGMDAATATIRSKLLKARIIASDETTTRTNGVTQWQWVFLSSDAVLHKIASRRARSVAEDVLGQHRPDVWVSDRYSGQQELGREHQVCLAHVLRDVQYAIDSGDTAFAPRIRDHLRWAIKMGNDETSSRTALWRPMRPKPTTRSIVWLPELWPIPRDGSCSSRSRYGGANSSSSSPIATYLQRTTCSAR